MSRGTDRRCAEMAAWADHEKIVVYPAVTTGLVVSREYQELTVANLKAVEQAVTELAAR